MAFDLGRAALVQPAGFGEMMGGFVGPAQILDRAPFQKALERKQAIEAGIFESGMGEIGANRRTEMTNDATLKLARERWGQEQKASRLAGIASLVSSGGLFGGGTNGRMAGNVFGVGSDGLSPTKRLSNRFGEQAELQEQMLRLQRAGKMWGAGSAATGAAAMGFAPPAPRI